MSESYYIEDGVRRAVAARTHGLKAVPAILHVPGQPSKYLMVDVDLLYSPKQSLSRSDRRNRYALIEAAMGTVAGRAGMPEIHIQLLGEPGQTASIPISKVQILP